MKYPAALLAALLCANSGAADTWLTIVGDPADPAGNTIQVDAVPIEVKDATRLMRVRVSRSSEISSPDGVRLRSFSSIVRIDCMQRTAHYVSTDFFSQPLWQGKPVSTMVYAQDQIRPMAFRDFEPNPNTRVIRAACAIGN